jgi:hypothetical protein
MRVNIPNSILYMALKNKRGSEPNLLKRNLLGALRIARAAASIEDHATSHIADERQPDRIENVAPRRIAFIASIISRL